MIFTHEYHTRCDTDDGLAALGANVLSGVVAHGLSGWRGAGEVPHDPDTSSACALTSGLRRRTAASLGTAMPYLWLCFGREVGKAFVSM